MNQPPHILHRMEPGFWGPPDQQIFGCFHPPASPVRECALVLCYPRGHEYLQFHRAFRQLAILLADAGFPVLRFDFRGCGDSAGAEEVWRLENWAEDVSSAIEELRRRTGAAKIGLVGQRLGGSLAVQVAAARGGVDALVLWDPVLSGKVHLEELAKQHRGMLRYAHVLERERTPRDAYPSEILGYAFPAPLFEDLSALDLLKLRKQPSRRVLVIESHPEVGQEPLCELMTRLVTSVEIQRFPNPLLWIWTEDYGKVHVPHKILQAIASWLSKEFA